MHDGRYTQTFVNRGRARDVAVPVLEGDLRLRRAQPALGREADVARPRAPVFVTELLRIAEEEASAELYGILKRADEST